MSKQTSSENDPKYPTSLEQLLRNTNLQREFSLGINLKPIVGFKRFLKHRGDKGQL